MPRPPILLEDRAGLDDMVLCFLAKQLCKAATGGRRLALGLEAGPLATRSTRGPGAGLGERPKADCTRPSRVPSFNVRVLRDRRVAAGGGGGELLWRVACCRVQQARRALEPRWRLPPLAAGRRTGL